MFFKRKAYDDLKKWKESYASKYAVLLEGARRVGKTTIAEQFAKNEYDSYILVDFANVSKNVTACFDDIDNLDLFFLRLQAVTGINLTKHRSVLIFDEIQLFPKARKAIKYLVKDGRYHYIETGSLISIKKNIKDILIPSEEIRISVYPMDYEEFIWALNVNTFDVNLKLFKTGSSIGQQTIRALMRNFRIYMAVGGMPQAVEAYVNGRNFGEIDFVKREILLLYENDFRKIDPSGRISRLYKSIPAQLSKNKKRFILSSALGKRKSAKDDELLFDLIDSKTVLISYNTTDPRVSLALTRDLENYKLYIADTGLFVTLMFMDRPSMENELYAKLLSDKLPANLGYLYENIAAQAIAASGRELYYHIWEKAGSAHYYEIDFLIAHGVKTIPIEIKPSGVGKHESLIVFCKKYSANVADAYIVSQKDVGTIDGIKNIPFFMLYYLL